MISKSRVAVAAAAAFMISSPAFADRDKDEGREGKAHEQRYDREGKRSGYNNERRADPQGSGWDRDEHGWRNNDREERAGDRHWDKLW